MKYLPEQIDSVFAQEGAIGLALMVRDDGSNDDTVAYLRNRDEHISVERGSNIGPCKSFLELLRKAKQSQFDFVALCDQDDVWEPTKLAAAIHSMPPDRPALYASALTLVDEELKPIGVFKHRGDRSFAATLLCNFVTGCTCVLNRKFLDALVFLPIPVAS